MKARWRERLSASSRSSRKETSMSDVAFLPVLVAAIAAFALGGTYYAVLGEQLAAVSPAAAAREEPPTWKLAFELLRCLTVAAVVAGLAVRGEIDEWAGGLLLGAALWIGFPLVLWIGAVIHENTSWRLARDPRRRLAREAAGRRRDRERLAVARRSAPDRTVGRLQ
jgi:hypothetical protein